MSTNESSSLLRQALEGPAPGTLQQALNLCKLVYMPSRNFAARTRVNYSNDLNDLIRFVEACGRRRLRDISQSDLKAYLADLDGHEYAGTSRKRKTMPSNLSSGFCMSQDT